MDLMRQQKDNIYDAANKLGGFSSPAEMALSLLWASHQFLEEEIASVEITSLYRELWKAIKEAK